MYQSRVSLGAVALNVVNLEKQIEFYTNTIGLAVLQADEKSAVLGIANSQTPLVKLYKVEKVGSVSYGLYHFAILLPTRTDLANVLYHFIKLRTPLQGAADHGYSEAIYLQDPEGNGIELLADKPVAEWDIDGERINGVTLELQADDLLSLVNHTEMEYRLPEGTMMGHFHLAVHNAQRSAEFYTQLLDMTIKSDMAPRAYWISSGQYHHHIAVNQWAGTNLSLNNDQTAGLRYLEMKVDDVLFDKLLTERIDDDEDIDGINSMLKIKDENGIIWHIIKANI